MIEVFNEREFCDGDLIYPIQTVEEESLCINIQPETVELFNKYLLNNENKK